MITYQAHPSGTQISPLPYAPTLELGASRYLNGGFDFRTRVSLSHKVNFPNAEGFFNSQLIDMNYQLAFKFNNGVFLKRNAFLGHLVPEWFCAHSQGRPSRQSHEHSQL